ncbi:hypothetical protein [Variovorax sp. E3]|uniref:hypothetical protein n=1 Tax=Variovorax sp. E3 TaxID=1914993 RepID=UPI0018DCD158|nr:hypothetical protein [Variovorax sp. E3]
MYQIPSRIALRSLHALAISVSLLASAAYAQSSQTAPINDTPLKLLLADVVRQTSYNPYAPHPGIRWTNGKDAGSEAEGTIQLPGAPGKPSVQAVLTIERDAKGRTTSLAS